MMMINSDLTTPESNIRPIPGYERYYITTTGEIYSMARKSPKKLNPSKDSDGYLIVGLCRNKKSTTKKVHRLVMETFVGPSSLAVNHKDFDRTNNTLLNLEYVTTAENNKWNISNGRGLNGTRNPKSKLDWAKVLTIHTVVDKMGITETARKFSVSDSAINLIRKGKNWSFIYNKIKEA